MNVNIESTCLLTSLHLVLAKWLQHATQKRSTRKNIFLYIKQESITHLLMSKFKKYSLKNFTLLQKASLLP